MKNTIAERIFDFLKDFPPFNLLQKDELVTISQNVKVIYLEENEFIFRQDDDVHDAFYIVKDGAIGVFRDNTILVDKCDEGDIFGLRAIVVKDNYLLSAKAIEESIIYSISSNLLESIIEKNIKANKFLIASFATNTRNPYSKDDKGVLFADIEVLQQNPSNFTEIQTADYSKNPVTCHPETSIKEAAKIMTDKRIGSIVITKNKKPLGIITDKDLRNKIATGLVSIDENVDKIMSSPVKTYPEYITVAEAQIAMMQHNITHLCITKDGTPESELRGILSEHDIVVIHGNNPSVLIKEVKRAKNTEDLKIIRQKAQGLLQGYLEQKIPVFFVSKIISAINDAITKRALEFSISELGHEPPVKFSWLALGSQGRKEQLLLTDQDNALIFEDVPKERYQYTQTYFLKLAKSVTIKLNTIGFEFCPAEMMASNKKWCKTLSEWKAQFNDWITHPHEEKIMLSTIFFDYDLIYGDKNLVDELTNSIFKSIDSYEIFLNFLGLNALKNPAPLSFFRQFLVEDSGEHKDQFDIKARAMMPLIDSARLLILYNNIKSHNNTILRLEKLAEIEPQNKELYLSCISAFKILLRFRSEQGLKHNDSGRFIDLKSLSKNDRLKLKSCFKPIKDIQELIRVRFKLSQIM